MEVDAMLLSRLQFAANISFHILFPTISIGLGWLLLYFRTRYTLTQDKAWEFAYQFWVKVFALTFALALASSPSPVPSHSPHDRQRQTDR